MAADAVLHTADGVAHLAPELQLLFKATGRRPKDDVDAAVVIATLEPERRRWLAAHLPTGHAWRELARQER